MGLVVRLHSTLIRSVPWLRYQNSQDRNIYIRPKGEHHLSMVDDLTADAIKRMKAEGYTPALVVETSPGNFQAWLNHGQVLPQRLSTLAARALAEKFGGDMGAADWRHFGRLAGFTNRKTVYQDSTGTFPFVRLAESMCRIYAMAGDFLMLVAARPEFLNIPQLGSAYSHAEYTPKTIADFRSNPAYGDDGNRIDMAYAIYAFAHRSSPESIAAAIKSRDLSKKGSVDRQEAYIARTIEKARQRVSSVKTYRAIP